MVTKVLLAILILHVGRDISERTLDVPCVSILIILVIRGRVEDMVFVEAQTLVVEPSFGSDMFGLFCRATVVTKFKLRVGIGARLMDYGELDRGRLILYFQVSACQ
jgi:hypothetical protein